MDIIKEYLPTDNNFFTGGFSLAVIGVGMGILRKGYQFTALQARRHLLTSLEVTSKDKAYPWVLQWLTAQGRRTQHLSVETLVKQDSSGHAETSFSLVPGPGVHLITYNHRILAIQRQRETTMLDLNSGKPWEKITFTTIGRSTKLFEYLLKDANELALKSQEGKLIVYTNWGSEWRPFGHPRRRRPIDSVILAEGVAERLLDDISEWRSSKEWYMNRGIPYRRGYLLHGTPGSGKTSFITALAGWLGYNICMLNLSEMGLTDERLAAALSVVPQKSIVLLEDIDAACVSRDINDYSGTSVTFSGLLNVLDGIPASEERILFMTTNHIERLDPALIRPGRVDVVEELGDATPLQCQRLYEKFYPKHQSKSLEFVQKLFKINNNNQNQNQLDNKQELPSSVSMAALQGYLLQHKDDAIGALKDVDQFLNEISFKQQKDHHHQNHDNNSNTLSRPTRPVRRFSSHDMDKLFYSPQSDADNIMNDTHK